jgi:hypothetical protein
MRISRRFAQLDFRAALAQESQDSCAKPQKIDGYSRFKNSKTALAQFPCHPPVHELHSIDE